jgi:hypothetical protein
MDPQWWKNYASSLLGLINPVAGVGSVLNLDFPAPHIPAPPTPDHWWRNDMPHPVYPMPQQGPPSEFGGAVLPNPNGVEPTLDTQMPATKLSGAQFAHDNFKGKASPARFAFPNLQGVLRQQ